MSQTILIFPGRAHCFHNCIYIYIYAIMKTKCPPSQHKAIAVITGRVHCFDDNIYIMLIVLLWDLSTLCVVDHLWPLFWAKMFGYTHSMHCFQEESTYFGLRVLTNFGLEVSKHFRSKKSTNSKRFLSYTESSYIIFSPKSYTADPH